MSEEILFNFLDVGMGDGTLVQIPPSDTGPLWLIDFGEKGSPFKIPIRDATKFLVTRITEVCKKRKVAEPTLDVLAISHADGDHWNKMDWIIEGKTDETTGLWEAAGWKAGTKLKIKTLIFGGDWEGDYEKRYYDLAQLIWDRSTTVKKLADKDHDKVKNSQVTPRWIYNSGDKDLETKVYLLSSNHPTKAYGGDCNPKSLVFMFQYRSYKVILTGDAESHVVEPAIIENYKNAPSDFLKAYGLKLGHHGSAASSSEEWLKKVRPAAIFASGDRRWGHPYCNPITRALNVGSIIDKDNRWYSCSSSGSENDYVSTISVKQICTNLWYVVTSKDGITRKYPNGTSYHAPYGEYTGVQWQLQIMSTGNPYITHTDQWPAA
jgi:competence protein ComEC